MPYPVHVDVAIEVGFFAAQPLGERGVDVELHGLVRQAALELFHRFAVYQEGYRVLIVGKGVVVKVLGKVEGELRGLGVGLFAARVGGEQDSARGVVVDLDVYLALEVGRLVAEEAGDGGGAFGTLMRAA
jgi:hypothetical protein